MTKETLLQALSGIIAFLLVVKVEESTYGNSCATRYCTPSFPVEKSTEEIRTTILIDKVCVI